MRQSSIYSELTKKSVGFTLAEVLITLGIIGVVAAMTIPNLINNYQKKQTVTKLQKAISVLNQVYRLAYDDVGEASEEEAFAMGIEEYFKTYWAPYLKVETYCTDYKVCGYNSNTPFKCSNGVVDTTLLISNNSRVTFYTSDGFLYLISVAQGSSTGLISNQSVVVDINGGKGANTYGKDVFVLTRMIDGEKGGAIVPFGYGLAPDKINNNCSKTGTGKYCAEKIKRAGWQIDSSYPW